jgi:biopolymer transport protein ExbB/TolQ
LDWLWAIGSLSPLFGLFGTVWGISQAFGKIKGVTDTRLLMQKLAGDINIALSTTIVGLLLAVPAFIFYYYFKYRIDNDATRIERYFSEITNRA